MEHAYWGKRYTEDEVEQALAGAGIGAEPLDESDVAERAAEELAAGRVVGWFQGRFEWGPRPSATAASSPTRAWASMKDVVNTKIKFREAFRPFAPSVLEEAAADVFDAGLAAQPAARFMLLAGPVRLDRRVDMPAVVHVDGTARPQVVQAGTSPLYHKVISRFRDLTGVAAVLNTSFNLRGEPIVASPADCALDLCP